MSPNVEHHEARQHASRLPGRKFGHFRDDQIMFVAEHTETLTNDEQARQYEAFTGAINSVLWDLYGPDEPDTSTDPPPDYKPPQVDASPPAPPLVNLPQIRRQARPPQVTDSPQVISFAAMTAEEKQQVRKLVERGLLTADEEKRITSPFSIATYDVNDTPPDPAALITMVQQLYDGLTRRFETEDLKIEGFTLRASLPNWLTSVASQGAGTGGPGGRPFPYCGSRQNAPYRFNIERQLRKKDIYGDGTGVDIVILDTAPSVQDLVRAYKELPDHPLVPTLLGPEGKLHLYPATYEDQLRMSCTSLNDHDYKMTDHGLFIAGIIHSIVPKAEIHLIEVLNQYGVGDFLSFVQGLMTVFDKIYKPDRKMVVNCSWMLEFPRDDLQSRHKDKDGDPDAKYAEIVRGLAVSNGFLDAALLRALQYLLNRLYGLGRQAVAAAGNDGKKEDNRGVEARYPAALTRVAGVGSLPKSPQLGENNKYIPSVFSNLSDTPERNGIATFGGEEGEGKGVLGLYIGEFPCCCCTNESKWAWWSGTSFATPILTAAVASVLSNGTEDIPLTQDAITKLYNTETETENGDKIKIIQNNKVRRQEDAFLVKQG